MTDNEKLIFLIGVLRGIGSRRDCTYEIRTNIQDVLHMVDPEFKWHEKPKEQNAGFDI